eukprot:scaffold312902_cov15-Prasinocladus_malaysianus.AAC.2
MQGGDKGAADDAVRGLSLSVEAAIESALLWAQAVKVGNTLTVVPLYTPQHLWLWIHVASSQSSTAS